MKRILFLLLVLSSFSSNAQCPDVIYADFDSGSIITQQINWFGHSINYRDFRNMINIDTVHLNNQWQIGRPQKTIFDSAHSYPNAIVTDTMHPCLPMDTSIFTMQMPIQGMGLCGFSFYYKLNIDSGDIALLEWSSDAGTHWTNIFLDSTHTFEFLTGKPDWTVSTIGWDSVYINVILSYPVWGFPDSFILRFTLITDSNSTPRDGWMLDDFSFGYSAEGIQQLNNKPFLTVYPDPATTYLTVTSSDPINTITINDLFGRAVSRRTFNSQQVQLDISDLPAGVYLIRINDIEVRRFVKQ